MKPQNKIPDWYGDESFERLEFLSHIDGMDLYLADRSDGTPDPAYDRVFLQIGKLHPQYATGYVFTSRRGWANGHVDSWDWSTPAIREFAKAFFALHQ